MDSIWQKTKIATIASNIITDGNITCPYQDIPRIFAKIQTFLENKNIDFKCPVMLESRNSASCALLILYFLELGHSFLLVPESREKPSAPAFCKYIFSVNEKSLDNNLNPEQFLRILENKKYAGATLNDSAKLYLRTSGSTGKPKMAIHSHEKLIKNALNCLNRLNIKSDDRVAIPVPINHMFGLGAAFLPAIAAGASIDLQKRANLIRYLDREKKFNPNMAFMTPVFCESLLKGRREKRPYRLTVSAGDRLREKTFEGYQAMFGPLVQLYGSTEMGAISSTKPDDPFVVRRASVGKPMPGARIRIENSPANSSDRTKKEGDIFCFHEYGFDGYADERGNVASLPPPNGWFPAKDLGRIRRDGRLEVLGRADQSVNRHGLLVFLADVEKKSELIQGLSAAVAVPGKESARGRELILYCVAVPDSGITEKSVRNVCFDLLPKNAVPDKIIFLDDLPFLPNGKVDRQKLNRMATK
ncbi:AMP-dependent synthetase and ligase [Candidatus Desulfarcum epimagneticum]|uniref:AMP-dependent synthetase and ligase n=1 Tax=uncultured Desulfobacteraceae bacterium TaxID=218296 RepID=A0A484HFQ7_9BACT|nr:AMP-dependent synthetase and ligase [uncultured Desulfobacteraceae bacterium]